MGRIPGLDAGSTVPETVGDALNESPPTNTQPVGAAPEGDSDGRTQSAHYTVQTTWSADTAAALDPALAAWPSDDAVPGSSASGAPLPGEEPVATESEIRAAEDSLLRLSRLDEPSAEEAMGRIINPRTGVAYTDTERAAAIERAEQREARQLDEEVEAAEDRLLELSRSDDPTAERTAQNLINPRTGSAFTDAERAAALERAELREVRQLDGATVAAEDHLLELSRSHDPTAERMAEHLINPRTGSAYTDAERAAAIERARAREQQPVEDRLLELSRSDDPTAEREMEQVINPRTGSAYTDAERAAAIDNALAREHALLNQVDGTVLEHRFAGTHPEAAALLANGAHDNHFLRAVDLDLDDVEAATNDFNGGSNHVVVQSIFDPVVAHKDTTIDEYSVVVELPEGVDPEEFLLAMAADMDAVLGGEFAELGDFKNQGTEPHVGQVIDIDVQDGPTIPGIGLTLESPFNAPVVISSIEPNRFSVQTIEYNGVEHLLHGTREWGFEELGGGRVRFYTRGVSVEDIQAAEGIPGFGSAKEGEFRFWNAWVDGVENYVLERGGTVEPGSRITDQTYGPSGNEIWETLSVEQQEAVRAAQIDGLEREIARLGEAQEARLAEFTEIRNIGRRREADELIERIERGDPPAEILRDLEDMIRDARRSRNVDEDVVREMDELRRDLEALDGRISAVQAEVDGWRTR